MFRIHPRTREFQLFCEGTSNPWGIAWDTRGERLRQRLRDRPPLAPDRDRLLPAPGRALSAVHLEARLDRRAPPPEGGLLRPALSSTATPIRPSTASGSTWATSTAAASTSMSLERDGSTYTGKRGPRLPDGQRCLVHARGRRRPGPTAASTSSTGTTAITATRTPAATREGIDRLKGRLYRVRYKDTPRAGRSTWQGNRRAADRSGCQPEHLSSATWPSGCCASATHAETPDRKLEAAGPRRRGPAQGADARPVGTGRHRRAGAGVSHSQLLAQRRRRLPRLGRAGGGQLPQGRCHASATRWRALAQDTSPDVQAAGGHRGPKIEGLDPLPLLVEVLSVVRRRQAHPGHRLAEPAPAAGPESEHSSPLSGEKPT